MFATVLIVGTLYHKDLILTYAIREGQTCLPGMLFAVRVRGRQERALALRLRREAGGGFRALELGDALYPTPVVSRRGLALARWLARHYVCPLNRAIALFLPPPTQPKQEIRYFVAADWRSRPVLFVEPRWQPLWDGLVKAGDRGMSGERIKARWDGAAAEQAELWYRAGYLRREIGFRRVGQRAGRGGEAVGLEGSLSLTLTADQQKAFDQVRLDIERGRAGRHLLFGVTGSGKTEVYLRCAALARDLGRQTIYLVPEISLVPQLAAKAAAWFDGQVAILHSNLTPAQRFAEWDRIRRGEVKLIIGPRSALFAPVARLGLIVIDEEHENTYKQSEPEPRYDARKTAEILGRLWRAPVVRGSATPDLESVRRWEMGELQPARLPGRVAARPMPAFTWVDMRKELREGHPHPVSRALLAALAERKAKGEQAILLMNRRGFHPYVLCRDCGKSLECPRCSIPLTYHRPAGGGGQPAGVAGRGRGWAEEGRLICHYCDYQSGATLACPHCGSRLLQYMGTGTQRVEDYLAREIPELRVLRLDMDSTARPGSHGKILRAFQAGEADALLGTQMVAKGFDFPLVTLSAVLHIDGILNLPDYQSGERAFQLILQTAGRAGRGERPGQVMVQTFYPENPLLRLAEQGDFLSFYQKEMACRQALDYPPAKVSARILVSASREEDAKAGLEEIYDHCRQSLPPERAAAVVWLGPARAPLERIKNRWRWHLILLAASWAPLASCLVSAREKAAAWGDEPRLILDMEPRSLL